MQARILTGILVALAVPAVAQQASIADAAKLARSSAARAQRTFDDDNLDSVKGRISDGGAARTPPAVAANLPAGGAAKAASPANAEPDSSQLSLDALQTREKSLAQSVAQLQQQLRKSDDPTYQEALKKMLSDVSDSLADVRKQLIDALAASSDHKAEAPADASAAEKPAPPAKPPSSVPQ